MSTTHDPVGAALHAGDLQGATQAVIAAVRSAPRDPGLRWLLAEMFLFSGDVERADKALAAVLDDRPGPAVLEFRRLLRADEQRHQVYTQGRLPQFQGDDPTPAQRTALRALTLHRAGEAAAALESAAEAETLRPRIAGTVDGMPFDDFRDVDDLLSPQLEILTTGGDNLLVPLERVASLVFDPVRRPRDMLWRRCSLVLRDGTEGLVFMPMLYPRLGSTDALRLGRETEWSDDGGPVRGTGLRLWLAGEDAFAATEVTRIDFA